MSAVLHNAFRESGADSFELPQRSRFNGPVASRRLRRTLAGYLVVTVLGLLPTVLETAVPWQALGLGLVVPGGGFLVFGWWAALGIALTLFAFAVAFLLWFATGNVVAPIVTWVGAALVASYDAAFGTRNLESLREPFLRGFREEMMTPAGDVIPFRSDYTGVSVPVAGELMYFQAAGWLAPAFPQLARTLWAIGCEEILRVSDGGLDRYLAKPFPFDGGNYRSTGLFGRAWILVAAREFGDQLVADAAERSMLGHNEPVESNGMRRFTNGSTLSNALAAQALLTRRGDWTGLITTSPSASARSGPILKHARFDQVTVAQAVSEEADLRIVLRAAPGLRPTDDVRLVLGRLRPQTSYSMDADGAEHRFESDDRGEATVSVNVGDRTALGIRPS